MIYVKTHKTEEREVVAMCDEDVLGKTFEEGEVILEVSERFYKGKLVDDETAKDILKNGDILNLVGKKIVNLALKTGVVSKINIIKIKGIPHAQVI